MGLYKKFLSWVGHTVGRKRDPIIIQTEWGPVSEKFRQQAAVNMRLNPELKAKIEMMVGPEEARRRYPEAYEGE